VVKYLLEQGANINANDDEALRVAAERGDLPMVECLLEHGANLHVLNERPLRLAVENDRLEVTECLLEHGADLQCFSPQTFQFFLRTKDRKIKLLLFYDLQLEEESPWLISLFLRINFQRKSLNYVRKTKLLSLYKRKISSEVERLLCHLYYRPAAPAFYRAVE